MQLGLSSLVSRMHSEGITRALPAGTTCSPQLWDLAALVPFWLCFLFPCVMGGSTSWSCNQAALQRHLGQEQPFAFLKYFFNS